MIKRNWWKAALVLALCALSVGMFGTATVQPASATGTPGTPFLIGAPNPVCASSGIVYFLWDTGVNSRPAYLYRDDGAGGLTPIASSYGRAGTDSTFINAGKPYWHFVLKDYNLHQVADAVIGVNTHC